jgi:hypothetical protein
VEPQLEKVKFTRIQVPIGSFLKTIKAKAKEQLESEMLRSGATKEALKRAQDQVPGLVERVSVNFVSCECGEPAEAHHSGKKLETPREPCKKKATFLIKQAANRSRTQVVHSETLYTVIDSTYEVVVAKLTASYIASLLAQEKSFPYFEKKEGDPHSHHALAPRGVMKATPVKITNVASAPKGRPAVQKAEKTFLLTQFEQFVEKNEIECMKGLVETAGQYVMKGDNPTHNEYLLSQKMEVPLSDPVESDIRSYVVEYLINFPKLYGLTPKTLLKTDPRTMLDSAHATQKSCGIRPSSLEPGQTSQTREEYYPTNLAFYKTHINTVLSEIQRGQLPRNVDDVTSRLKHLMADVAAKQVIKPEVLPVEKEQRAICIVDNLRMLLETKIFEMLNQAAMCNRIAGVFSGHSWKNGGFEAFLLCLKSNPALAEWFLQLDFRRMDFTADSSLNRLVLEYFFSCYLTGTIVLSNGDQIHDHPDDPNRQLARDLELIWDAVYQMTADRSVYSYLCAEGLAALVISMTSSGEYLTTSKNIWKVNLALYILYRVLGDDIDTALTMPHAVGGDDVVANLTRFRGIHSEENIRAAFAMVVDRLSMNLPQEKMVFHTSLYSRPRPFRNQPDYFSQSEFESVVPGEKPLVYLQQSFLCGDVVVRSLRRLFLKALLKPEEKAKTHRQADVTLTRLFQVYVNYNWATDPGALILLQFYDEMVAYFTGFFKNYIPSIVNVSENEHEKEMSALQPGMHVSQLRSKEQVRCLNRGRRILREPQRGLGGKFIPPC